MNIPLPSTIGSDAGREFARSLYSIDGDVRVSLVAADAVDVSFLHEAVILPLTRFHQLGLTLRLVLDPDNRDVLANVGAAALFYGVPIYVTFERNGARAGTCMYGQDVPDGCITVFTSVCGKPQTSADVASALGLSVQHASNKLSLLWKLKFLVREERVQESGGKEFVYRVAAP